MRIFVIAEIASSHDGELTKALRLVDAVADAGADVAKAEYWSDADKLADRRQVPGQFREHYRRYAVPRAWLPTLKAQCDARGIEFMATTYLTEDISVVAPFVKRFKIAGFEVQDRAFVSAHAPFGKPLIASVPLSVMGPWYEPWMLGGPVYLLHCCQSYPVGLDDLHLDFIGRYGFEGFSDHSGVVDVGAAAVLAGARIVEAHVKLDETDPTNYDAGPHAHTPAAFAEYVRLIRRAERMVGSGEKAWPFACEAEVAGFRVTA